MGQTNVVEHCHLERTDGITGMVDCKHIKNRGRGGNLLVSKNYSQVSLG